MGVVLIKHRSESQWTVLLEFLTISTNVMCYYCVIYNNFVFQQDSALVLHSTQSNCCSCSAKPSTSFLLSCGPITVHSLTVPLPHEHELQVERVNKLSQQLVKPATGCINSSLVF